MRCELVIPEPSRESRVAERYLRNLEFNELEDLPESLRKKLEKTTERIDTMKNQAKSGGFGYVQQPDVPGKHETTSMLGWIPNQSKNGWVGRITIFIHELLLWLPGCCCKLNSRCYWKSYWNHQKTNTCPKNSGFPCKIPRQTQEDLFQGLGKLKVLWLTGNHYQPGEKGYKKMKARLMLLTEGFELWSVFDFFCE